MEQSSKAHVLARLIAGKMPLEEAALLLGRSERTVWRLKARFLAAAGPEGLAHGNCGRAPANRIDAELRATIVAFAKDGYAGLNDSHLADLLVEREGMQVSRSSVQRILRAHGIASPRTHRAPKYRSRRDRRAAQGMLVQLDGSPHRWFGPEAPEASLLLAVDDATGEPLAAIFREQEDAAGYLELLRQLLTRYGVPLAVYSDRHSSFRATVRGQQKLFDAKGREREATQLGRAFAELDVEQIFANSPQAKGRVERIHGTFQDRLVAELRLAGIRDIDAANRFLPSYLTRYSARFAKPPQDPVPAWRPLPAGVSIESVCCLKYSRLVAADNTISFAGQVLQLPPKGLKGSWRHERVEVRHHLDGSFGVHAPGGRELARSATPRVTPRLRAQDTPAPLGGVKPLPRSREHPWRKWQPGQFRGRNARLPPGAA